MAKKSISKTMAKDIDKATEAANIVDEIQAMTTREAHPANKSATGHHPAGSRVSPASSGLCLSSRLKYLLVRAKFFSIAPMVLWFLKMGRRKCEWTVEIFGYHTVLQVFGSPGWSRTSDAFPLLLRREMPCPLDYGATLHFCPLPRTQPRLR